MRPVFFTSDRVEGRWDKGADRAPMRNFPGDDKAAVVKCFFFVGPAQRTPIFRKKRVVGPLFEEVFPIPGLQDFCFSTKILDFIHFPENGVNFHGFSCGMVLDRKNLRILGM